MATQAPATSADKDFLAEATMTDPVLMAHPNEFYAIMRRADPVHFDEKLGSWLVSRHEDILAIQADPLTFSVNKGYHTQQARGMQEEFQAILERDGGGYFPDAIMSDPPYHTRIRKLMENAFTAHRVKELEPRIAAVVGELIEGLADQGKADAVIDFAVPLTIRIICEQLGLDYRLKDKIYRWSQAVTAQIGRMQTREQMVEHAAHICDLQNYLIAEMKSRETAPREDMISDIVHARIAMPDGSMETLNFAEAVSLVRAILIAGNDTTATALGNLFFILCTKPDIARLLKDSVDDDRLLNRFVEELMRIEPPVRALSRMTTREVLLGETLLPANAHLMLVYASANDQEDVFPDPRRFDINRPNIGRHLSFGGGVHRCVGIALARMEVKVAAREIIKRMDNFKLDIAPQDIRFLPTVATRTIERLPIFFSRAGG